ncbi:MAG: ribosomal RNA small subunit methyltransferase A [Planctomycetota bacterium]|nr:MAG: ribosomal RNA small subunit methyltransferase A [Planctomycetota bacterium]
MAGAHASDPDRWAPAALRRLFRERGFVTRRSLGQHLLLDPRLLHAIVDTGGLEPGDLVLEVGTGPGMLTRLLLDRGAEVVGIELDPNARALLTELIGAHERLHVVAGDVLAGPEGLHPELLARLETARDAGRPVRCIANFPYHVATPLLVRLLELGLVERRFPLVTIAGTLQREVAERLAAPPGDRRMGPASILLQALAEIEIVRRVPPGAFWPPPKVHSAVVRITARPPAERLAADAPRHWARFRRLVRGLYVFRRKTLRNALRRSVPDLAVEQALAASGLPGGARVETLSPAQLATLASTEACSARLDAS